MNNRRDYLLSILSTLPDHPGCYQFYNRDGVIIYIGKAKNLRKRVTSYFQKDQTHDIKTRIMVNHIYDIKHIIVETEDEALLMENNLIKQYMPKYNIQLKDDKTYPSIVIKNEYFPRVFLTRSIIKDGSIYFGPYASVSTAKAMLQSIEKIYPLRYCKLPLTPESIAKGKYRECLEYHMKRCKAPCIGGQTVEEYNQNIEEIKEILKGNVSRISKHLRQEVQTLTEKQRFDAARESREKYHLIENYRAKSAVVTGISYDIDVFSYDENDSNAYINGMCVDKGAVVQVYTIEYEKTPNATKEDLLGLGIIELRERTGSMAKEIIVPFLPKMPDENALEGIKLTIPQRGDKQKLLNLSLQNAKQYKINQMMITEKVDPEQHALRVMQTMQRDLKLSELPAHIECFDNSNIQGTSPVAACVVFKNGKPSKQDYRRFHIKTVIGADDFASMTEVVTRRYTRLLNENAPLPQLIIADGGKGQLNAVVKVLKELNLLDRIAVIGLAKRMEEIFFPGDPVPLVLDRSSETLRLIQQLRDEAHRFGITFHRNIRSKKMLKSSVLDEIKGIGVTTRKQLLQEYKTVSRMRAASAEELERLIGKHKTRLLLKGFRDNPV